MSMFRESPTTEYPKGQVSMRRVLAAFFAVTSIVLAIIGTLVGMAWQGISALFGIPVSAVLLLMFFTTWGDMADAVKKVKGE